MPKKNEINLAWFQHHLALQGLSQRRLAQLLNLDPSGVSLFLSGQRKLKISEAGEIARIFSVPVEEVLEMSGVDLPESSLSDGKLVKVVGYVTNEWEAIMTPPKGAKTVVSPIHEGKGLLAIRFHTPKFMALDGAHAYFAERGIMTPQSVMIGRPSVIETESGKWVVGVIRRGYESGTHNAEYPSGAVEYSVKVKKSHLILWMKM